jgi:deoxyribonuclease-4
MADASSNAVRRIGAHTSIAGDLSNAANEAVELGCNTFQIFSRSPRMWRSAPLHPDGVAKLKEARARHDLWPMVIHGNYLVNMAAADSGVRNKSIQSFREEVTRALTLGADYLVIHPGSYRGQTLEKAIAVLASAIAKAVKSVPWNGLQLLLENTAGGGQSIGRDFTELAELRERIEKKASVPVGFCIDTAHCYEAGFDLSTAKGLRETTSRIEQTIGMDSVKVIHANDSRTPLGSRADRHEHIGRGGIGREGFRRISQHPKWRGKPFILETPHGEDGTHLRNVSALKTLSRRRARKGP